MKLRRVSGALAVVALTIGGALAGGGSAQAAGPDFCPDRYVCVYHDANWVHMIASWNGGETGNKTIPSNQATSWQNHSSWNWCAYDAGTNPDAYYYTMTAASPDSSYVGSYANDKVEYAKRC